MQGLPGALKDQLVVFAFPQTWLQALVKGTQRINQTAVADWRRPWGCVVLLDNYWRAVLLKVEARVCCPSVPPSVKVEVLQTLTWQADSD